MKIDYDQYRFTKLEVLHYLAEGVILGGLINYLCYRSWWAFVILLPVPWLYLREKRRQLIIKRKQMLNYAFKDALTSLSVALKAGYSMENAVSECIGDLTNIYSSQEPIVQEFCYIRNRIRVSVPIEILFQDFGNRSGVEDIQNFASIYGIAKRSGGNLSKILQNTAKTLNDKIEVQKEVEACVAAKKMEQGIMACVPCGIVLYMQMMSPGFLDALYGNPMGICIMTVCLAGYMGAFWMGRRIVNIEV